MAREERRVRGVKEKSAEISFRFRFRLADELPVGIDEEFCSLTAQRVREVEVRPSGSPRVDVDVEEKDVPMIPLLLVEILFRLEDSKAYTAN